MRAFSTRFGAVGPLKPPGYHLWSFLSLSFYLLCYPENRLLPKNIQDCVRFLIVNNTKQTFYALSLAGY
jgi:hypothetical protein